MVIVIVPLLKLLSCSNPSASTSDHDLAIIFMILVLKSLFLFCQVHAEIDELLPHTSNNLVGIVPFVESFRVELRSLLIVVISLARKYQVRLWFHHQYSAKKMDQVFLLGRYDVRSKYLR